MILQRQQKYDKLTISQNYVSDYKNRERGGKKLLPKIRKIHLTHKKERNKINWCSSMNMSWKFLDLKEKNFFNFPFSHGWISRLHNLYFFITTKSEDEKVTYTHRGVMSKGKEENLSKHSKSIAIKISSVSNHYLWKGCLLLFHMCA